MNDTYFVQSSDGASLHGHMLQCGVCGRKILLEMVVNGTQHHSGETVTCAECLHINKEFGDKHPEIVARIEEWRRS